MPTQVTNYCDVCGTNTVHADQLHVDPKADRPGSSREGSWLYCQRCGSANIAFEPLTTSERP